MKVTAVVQPHPLLDLGAFVVRLSRAVGETPTPAGVTELAAPGAISAVQTSDRVRTAVRDLLRHGGFKPAGRSKPASEYLTAASAEHRFPRINALVDTCNVVSLHSGLPISVVDLDKLEGELSIRIAPPSTTYVFNPSGQTIDASGLVALWDAQGPAGTPVKDAQRTKTDERSRNALAIVWGTRALPDHTARTTRWYRELSLTIEGATVEDVALG